MSAAAPLYEIRSPEQTILYSVVASELETFLAEQRSAEHEVPRFVEREFRAFLGRSSAPWVGHPTLSTTFKICRRGNN